MMPWVRVAKASDIPKGSVLGVQVGDRDIAVYHLQDGTFSATDNVCTHEYARLSEGWLDGEEIECPLHAGRFDVRTGEALCEPVVKDLEVYEVKQEGDDLFIEI